MRAVPFAIPPESPSLEPLRAYRFQCREGDVTGRARMQSPLADW